MSLFDRIKSVFTGRKPEEKEETVESTSTEAELEEVGAEAEEVEEEIAAVEVELDETEEQIEEVEEEVDEIEAEVGQAEAEIKEVEDIKEVQPAEAVIEEPKETARFAEGLKKSRKSLSRRINELLANFRYVDEEFFEDVEDMLIESDVGFEATLEISDKLREEAAIQNVSTMNDAERVIVETLVNLYEEYMPEDEGIQLKEDDLTVILFVGVNGVGKTTSIAKLAHQYREAGKKVMLAAGDTFRAGAIEQLEVWGKRIDAEVVSTEKGGDPAAVVFDAIEKAKEKDVDILMVDTAGRLQNKKNLMNELEKMKRVITREIPDGPHEVLLVLDATTGQNALIQAKEFKQTTDVTGIVLTKMDGTAKGGIVLAIGKELGIPVKFVGFGESMNDLRRFDTERFAYGLFSELVEEV